MVIDNKLNWHKNIEFLINKCNKRINLLRSVAGNYWANQKLLITFYQNVIRSILDYGCFLYINAPLKSLRKLDTIQYKCLRICTGAIHGTALSVMQIETKQLPLHLRRLEMDLKFTAKCKLHNKVYSTHSRNQEPDDFSSYTNHRTLLALHYFLLHTNMKFEINYPLTSGNYQNPLILDDTLIFQMGVSSPNPKLTDLNKITSTRFHLQYKNSLPIFTDGSVINNTRAASAVCVPAMGYMGVIN